MYAGSVFPCSQNRTKMYRIQTCTSKIKNKKVLTKFPPKLGNGDQNLGNSFLKIIFFKELASVVLQKKEMNYMSGERDFLGFRSNHFV